MKATPPPDLLQAFQSVEYEFVETSVTWDCWKQLFRVSMDQNEVLEQSASGLFRRIYRSLLHATVMGIGRLLDQPGSGKRACLSFERLTSLLKPVQEQQTTEEMTHLIEEARVLAAPLTEFRNKSVGHKDHAVATGQYDMPEFTDQLIDEILGVLEKILLLAKQTCDPVANDDVYRTVYMPGSAAELILVLRDGIAARELQESGKIAYGDLPSSSDSAQSPPA